MAEGREGMGFILFLNWEIGFTPLRLGFKLQERDKHIKKRKRIFLFFDLYFDFFVF